MGGRMSTLSDQTLEYAKLLEQIKRQFPDVFRHIIGLIRTLLK
jgi:hypothetical protein